MLYFLKTIKLIIILTIYIGAFIIALCDPTVISITWGIVGFTGLIAFGLSESFKGPLFVINEDLVK